MLLGAFPEARSRRRVGAAAVVDDGGDGGDELVGRGGQGEFLLDRARRVEVVAQWLDVRVRAGVGVELGDVGAVDLLP